MNAITELADLVARRSVEHEPDDEESVAFSWPHLVGRLTAAGETTLAAKALLGARRAGKHVDSTKEVEAAAKRLRAVAAAESFRAVNKANNTNYPLPAWVRAEMGVTH